MKITAMMSGVVALGLLGTGCATKKYVTKTVAPIDQRTTAAEAKNVEQDKQLATQGSEIENLDRGLSQTKEKLSDTDAKATAAGQAAAAADQKAGNAQQAADGAKQAADGARSFAEDGLNRMDEKVQAANKYQMLKQDAVLFSFNSDKLTPDAKAKLDDLAKQVSGMDRYVIEVQGFTDKSGDAVYNDGLSERRAQAVARYVAKQDQIPVRSISMLGVGYAEPVADDKTSEGRKMNRRVEVRVWVPGTETTKAAAGGDQQQ
jgi:outer membrane protein OmpA-like peptidoglycan-associated protein